MNNLHRELLMFFINFISNSTESEISDVLIRRMMKDKTVQQIIIECLVKLEPILTNKILQINSTAQQKLMKRDVKEPKLIVLAKEIQNLMNNFELIKGSLASVYTLVEDIEHNLIHKNIERKPVHEVNQTKLVNFLSELSEKKNLPNFEIEEISKDTWIKHMEVEQMLAAELYLYEIRWKAMENLHMRRINHIKEKTGLKILELEKELEVQKFMYIQQLAQEGMKLEEKLILECQRDQFEKSLLKEEINEVFIPDLLTAVEKIKSLLQIRQILEYNRVQDEKIINVLNLKLQTMADEYFELQEKFSKAAKNFAILSECFEKTIKYSKLENLVKNQLTELMGQQNYNPIEKMFNEQKFLDKLWKDKDFKGLRNSIIYANKEDNKINVSKLLLSSENFQKDHQKSEPKSKSKTPRLNTNIKNHNTSPLSSPARATDNFFNSVKKIMSVFDADLKIKNKKLADSLSAISANFSKQKFKFKEIPIKTRQSEVRPTVVKVFADLSIQTEIDFRKFNVAEQSCQTDVKEFYSVFIQTELSSLDVTVMEEKLKVKDIRQEFWDFMKDKLNSQGTQTDKKIIFKEFEDSKLLARGIMKKFTLPPSRLSNDRKTPYDAYSLNSNLLKSVETGLTSTPIEAKNEEVTKVNEELTKATEEYNKEFGIYSQFLGYKKLDFGSIQKLWEEVINRRLTEGESDQITNYLQGIVDTQEFESEKNKIIEMLMKVKKHSYIKENYEIIFKDFRIKLKTLNNWRRLLILFYKSHSGIILKSSRKNKTLDIYIISKFLRIINQDLRSLLNRSHVMKKSETSLIFKNEKWINNSNSPILINKKIVQSKLSKSNHNQTFDRFLRSKTPTRKRLPLVIR